MTERAFLTRVRIEPLDRVKHDRAAFSCGDERLDNYLKSTAARQQDDEHARINVACLDDSFVVIGYYALNAHSIDASSLPEADRKKLPAYPTISAVYLSKIGVHADHQGLGLGSHLMGDVFRRCVDAATIVGAHFIVLDALNEGAARLYRRLGFVHLPGNGERMLIKMSVVRKAIADALKAAVKNDPMELQVQGGALTGPGWHLNPIVGPDGEIQLFDIFVENQWIGSRRTETQCLQAVRDAGGQVPPEG
jgi:ribosomal protein S18 acetylase RimI-like enzyme